MMQKYLIVATLAAAPSVALAATFVDTTDGTATNDGTINGGEYAVSTNGANGSFGDVIGSNSTLFIDSSTTGGLNFGLDPVGGINDVVVIYIDSVAGGIADTTGVDDRSFPAPRAITGNSDSGSSEIFFARDFLADFAITIENGFSGLFSLSGAGTGITLIRDNNLNPDNTSNAAASREINLALSNLGIAPGDSFKFVATYISGTAFRSNEFIGAPGAASANSDGDIGNNDVTLAAGDFHTFVAVPEPASLLAGCGLLSLVALRRR